MQPTRLPAKLSRSAQPASAHRDARHGRPSQVGVLPEEFFDSRVRLAAVCPETALMYAVLEDAFRCFQQQFEMERRGMPPAGQAEKWFFSDDFHWLFSFLSVCDVLGLQPQFIRMKLRHWSQSRVDRLPRKM
jgi:hypothetical protein